MKRMVLVVLGLMLVGSVAYAGSVAPPPVATVSGVGGTTNDSTVTINDGSPIRTAAATYTVWYRFPGQRWHGYGGYSYYDACQARDRYLRQGAQSYIERD